MGEFVIREHLMQKMRGRIDKGDSFQDAAFKAGIPYQLMLAQLPHDEELRSWFAECSGRPIKVRGNDVDILPQTVDPLRIKYDLLEKMVAAGINDRIAEVVAHARVIDPETRTFDREGIAALGFAAKIYEKLLPRETKADITQNRANIRDVSDEELYEEAARRQEEAEQHSSAIERARMIRESGGAILPGPNSDIAG